MKKFFTKCTSFIIAVLMMMHIASFFGVKTEASVYYDRKAAVSYAAKHWNDGVGQCAEFVSACLTAGGLSVSQKVCLNLWNTLKKYGTPYKLTATSSGNGNIKLSSNKGKVEAGDPLFYVCETCGGTSGKSAFPHVVICGGTDSSGYLTAYGHNAAWNNKKVWTQFSAGAHSTHKTNIYSIHIESGNTTSYTITYDANGGSGAPKPQKYSSDEVTLSSTTPYRTGYSFQGWITTSEPQTVNCVYTPGSTQISMGNITLYAYWKANKYTIKYNANGGSGSMSSTSHEYDENKALSKNSFTRSGYSFVGWSQSSNATSATYSDGQKVKNLTSTNGATVNLYAVWKKNTYTLSYNANGGTGAPSTQSGSTSYTISSTKPTRSGNTFLGWSTSNSATSASYTAGDKITLSANTTLYAVWQKITYTLSYNVNGGTGAPSTQSGSTSYTISSTKPTRSGYTFLGWSTSNSATSASYTSGDKITLSANTTLYAVWQKITYTLSYNANGGAGAPSTQSGSTSYTISSTKPTRSGYTFLGWSTSNSATSANYTAGDKITLSQNTTLYAVWQEITYTLSYNANGGTGAPSTQSGSTSYTISYIMPTKSGYTFLGWSTSAYEDIAEYSAGDWIRLSGDATLYAVWQKEVTERTTEELRYTEKAGTTKGVSVTEYVNTTEYETVNRETYVTELTVEEAESLTGNAFIELITESETEAENTTNEEQKSNVNDSNNVLKIIGLIAAMALAAAITAFIMKKKK